MENKSNIQVQKDPKPSNDDDEEDDEEEQGLPYCTVSESAKLHGTISPLPNAGFSNPAPGKSPLTIKSLEIDLSPIASKHLLTVADLASILGISRPTIYRLVEDRKIPFLKLGSLIRFTKANVEQFLNERQINPIL